MDEQIWFLLIYSAGIFLLMEVAKHFLKGWKPFKEHKPVIPLILGAILGPLLAPTVYSSAPWQVAVFGGMLAGAMSSSIYEILEKRLKTFSKNRGG